MTNKLYVFSSIYALITLLVFASQSFALVFGGSNLTLSRYSEHSCYKPTKPIKPYKFTTQWEVDSYNSQVDLYNNERNSYIDCINTYIENANNDIKRIREKAEEALSDARSSY